VRLWSYFQHEALASPPALQDDSDIDGETGRRQARWQTRLIEVVPLESEGGYDTQIMAPDIAMRHSIIWPARAW
jgi:hypothetical protein